MAATQLPAVKPLTLQSALNPHSLEAGDPYYVGDIYSRLRVDRWSVSRTNSFKGRDSRSYLEYVRSLSTSWHHLGYLADFMDTSTVPVKLKWLTPDDRAERRVRVTMCSLEWSPTAGITREDYNTVDDLNRFMSSTHSEYRDSRARLIVVQDLSSTIIEALGSKFDIDPRFFRSHFGDYTWYNLRDPWVELPELASAWRRRSFFNIRYAQGRYFENESSAGAAESQAGCFNVLRRIDRDRYYKRGHKHRTWMHVTEGDVGLVRRKMSIWVRQNKPNETGWLGIMLLDPTIAEGYPLWGGYGNLRNVPSLRDAKTGSGVPPQSTYEAFIDWAMHLTPEELETVALDPAYLTSHMYVLIFSEWLIVLEYAATRLSQIEWELETEQWRGPQGLDETLSKLQPWRRRIPVYVSFVKATKGELECRRNSSFVSGERWEDTVADIDGIYERIKALQERVDKIMNVVTAVISIEESKKAMQEARSVTRITYLAFVFIPMEFTASFLGMSTTFPAGSRVYWVFFVVALPLSALAVVIAVNWATLERWWDQRGKRD